MTSMTYTCYAALIVFLSSAAAIWADRETNDCINGPSNWYRGSLSVTRSGRTCQRWDSVTPHRPYFVPSDGGHHNHCRNPDNDIRGLWCYTNDPDMRWEYCKIPKCHDESLFLWSDYHDTFAHILSVHADPELIDLRTSHTGHFNLSVVLTSKEMKNTSDFSEYTSITGSFDKQIIYFLDRRTNYVGRHNMITQETTMHLQGRASTIKSIALDLITGNLYWTDSMFHTVVVANGDLTYQADIHHTALGLPMALSIHSSKRKIFFSVFKPFGSTVISMDTFGKDVKVLLKFPKVFEVYSIAVDSTEDKIYMVDRWRYGAVVFSTDLDGENMFQHYYRAGSHFNAVASYLEHIYVSDESITYNHDGEARHSLYVIGKKVHRTMKYSIDGKPGGVLVLRANETTSKTESSLGSCSSMPKCAHICLPRIGTARHCACSFGFTKEGDTRCRTSVVSDSYLLVADSGRRGLFQMNLTDASTVARFSSGREKVQAVATDPMRRRVIWSETNQLVSSTNLGEDRRIIERDLTVTSMAVDYQSGNTYYYKESERTIYATNGKSRARIVSVSDTHTDVKSIAVDASNRHIYWITVGKKEGSGEVWRSFIDGSQPNLILNNLHWPSTVIVHKQRSSLFVTEAKKRTLIEIPLSSLQNLTEGSSRLRTEFDLNDATRKVQIRATPISQLTIHKEQVFFNYYGEHQIRMLNLTDSSMQFHGEINFYKISSLATYDSTEELFETAAVDPCKGRCDGTCIPTYGDETSCMQ